MERTCDSNTVLEAPAAAIRNPPYGGRTRFAASQCTMRHEGIKHQWPYSRMEVVEVILLLLFSWLWSLTLGCHSHPALSSPSEGDEKTTITSSPAPKNRVTTLCFGAIEASKSSGWKLSKTFPGQSTGACSDLLKSALTRCPARAPLSDAGILPRKILGRYQASHSNSH